MSLLIALVVLGLSLGILLAGWVSVSWAWGSLAALFFVFMISVLGRRGRGLVAAGLVFLGAGAVGSVDGALLGATARPPCSVGRLVGKGLRRLEVEILSPGQGRADGGTRQVARAVALLRAGRAPIPLCGKILVYAPPGRTPLWPGQRAVLRTRLRTARGNHNPGSASLWRYQLFHGLVARATIYHAGSLLVLAPRARPSWIVRLRGGLRRGLARVEDRSSRGILAALVLGDRGLISRSLRRDFARAGLGHLLAVSGLHLSLIALAVFGFLSAFLRRIPWLAARGDPRRMAALFAVAVALLYTILTGAAPSTVRACTMVTVALGALCLGRSTDFLRPLALAALLLLTWEPLSLFRAAFQLSFSAVVGIALIVQHPRWRRIQEALGRGGAQRARLSLFRRLLRGGATLLVVSLGASVLTAPLVAKHFGNLPLGGLFANLLAVPLTSFFLLPAAILGAVLAALWAPLGAPILDLAAWAAHLLIVIAEGVASISSAVLEVRPSWAVALGILALLLALLLGRAGWSRRLLVILGGAFVLAGTISWGPTALRATFFDVGQGDSALLRFPTGEAMLIDTGGSERGSYDPGARNVLPALRALGVRRLAVLAISHPHADHIAGAKAILEGLEVGEVWVCWHDDPNAWIRRLRGWARAQGVPLRRPRRWRRGDVTVEPLWPRGRDTCALPGLGPNDNSVVLRVAWGSASILFTGDIERYAETALVEGGRRGLRATVLKVPHHGSETSSTLALLRAVRPRLAVISVGRGNRFGLPDAAALRRYHRLQIPVLRIDRLGAIDVDLWPSGRFCWSPAVSPLD